MSSWSEWFVTPVRVVKTLYWSSKFDVQFNSAVVQLWKPVWKVQMLTFVCQVNAGWCFGSRSTTLPSRVLKEVLLLGKAPVIQCFCTFVCMWVSTASSKPNIYDYIHPSITFLYLLGVDWVGSRKHQGSFSDEEQTCTSTRCMWVITVVFRLFGTLHPWRYSSLHGCVKHGMNSTS